MQRVIQLIAPEQRSTQDNKHNFEITELTIDSCGSVFGLRLLEWHRVHFET
jgi:hypothetical protein